MPTSAASTKIGVTPLSPTVGALIEGVDIGAGVGDQQFAEIRQAFEGYAAAAEGWALGRGCLLCNTAVERGALDPGSGRYVEAYLARIKRAFRNALGNAHQAGDVAADADLDELADFLTTALIGVAACIRAEAPADQVRAACRVATGVLDAAPR